MSAHDARKSLQYAQDEIANAIKDSASQAERDLLRAAQIDVRHADALLTAAISAQPKARKR